MALQAKAKVFKAIARELYPVLQEHTDSLAHAKQSCEIFKTVIIAAMNKYWEGKTVKDLGLLDELTKEEGVKDRELNVQLITILADVPLGDAQNLLQGMNQTLDMYLQEQAAKIALKDVDVKEIVNED